MTIKQVLKLDDGAPVKIWTEDVEDQAMAQLRLMSQLPFIHSHIAVMPDVHAGIGSTVGSVFATVDAIVPAAVGVDIGCGMMAVKLSLKAHQLPDTLAPMRAAIEAAVPHGRSDNGGKNDKGAWPEAPEDIAIQFRSLMKDPRILEVKEKEPEAVANRGAQQLCTLGTGNHFIEVCLDKEDSVWLMLHSGSRGMGNRIGTHFIRRAKEEMARWYVRTPHPDLAYLPRGSKHFDTYWKAVSWAQDYAQANRALMMQRVLRTVKDALEGFGPMTSQLTAVNCHHNYVSIENHYGKNVFVTRKGAVRARAGDLGIIPGSMGARSFIVRGLGNAESFCSCSHGAGRRMSRTAARAKYGLGDLVEQTAGVECRKDADVIDEIPGAYKDIQQVMDNQSDLVETVAELHQVLCVKG